MRDLPATPETEPAKFTLTTSRYDDIFQQGKWRVGFSRANGRGVWQGPHDGFGRFQAVGKCVIDLHTLPAEIIKLLTENGFSA